MANTGLAGAVVADTQLSKVDGVNGVLIYRGYDILDLAANATFEEVAYLLWYGKLPNVKELKSFSQEMAPMRALPELVAEMLPTFPKGSHPMAVLRTAVSAMGLADKEADNLSTENMTRQAMLLTSTIPTIIASWERIRNGKDPIAPREDLGIAANFLYMLNGEEPNEDAVAALDAYLVCLADHGFNASTFSCRVTFATISDMYSAITSGIGTLKGNAHGRANQLAMEQFINAYESGDVAAWYHRKRENGERIMGIGHRVYKAIDPRGRILGPLAEKLSKSSGAGHWYDVAAEIEAMTREDDYFVERKLYANVDYYSAIVLMMVGLPTDQFTCGFAMSRIVGWSAHVLEQNKDNRLIRPSANYTGELDLQYVPLEDRE